MIVTVPQPGRAVGEGMFSDIAGCVRVGWGARGLEVEFDRPLTGAERSRVWDRCAAASDAEEADRVAARAFLSVDSPTGLDKTAQVQVLTRLVLNDYGTDGG